MVKLQLYYIEDTEPEAVLDFVLDHLAYSGERTFNYAHEANRVTFELEDIQLGVDRYVGDYLPILEEIGFMPSMSLWIEVPDEQLKPTWRMLIPVIISFLDQSDSNAVMKADIESLLVRIKGQLVLNSNLWDETERDLVRQPYELISDIDIWLIENLEEEA